MKAKNLFFGALTCLAFAACSNDDEPIVNGGAQAEGGQYLAVNIVNPTANTRANVYEEGTGSETKVNDVILVFLDGTKIILAKEAELEDKDGVEDGDNDEWNGGDTAPETEKISTAVVYLVPSETQGNPTAMLAILNGSKFGLNAATIIGKGTLSALLNEISNYDVEDDYFLMTNSVWKENADAATEIKETDFKSSKDLAQNNPVDIYVERVVAKIKVNQAASITYHEDYKKGYTVFDKDLKASTKFIKPLILGYHLAASAQESHLLKKIDAGWTTAGWNDATNMRSYWAESPDLTDKLNYNRFSTWQYAPADGETYREFYCQENTTASPTKMVVLAEHKIVVNATDIPTSSSTDLDNLIYCNGGYYDSEDAYIALLANELSKKYKVSDPSWDWSAHLEVSRPYDTDNTAKQWTIIAQLKDFSAVTFTDLLDAAVTSDAINNSLKDDYSGLYWKDGKAYYYVDVKHDLPSPMNVGVVRNHVYQLTISSIKGLGSPVYDPNDDDPEDTTPDLPTDPDPETPIIPETPTYEETYVAARINVLKWRIVTSQNVNLGQ